VGVLVVNDPWHFFVLVVWVVVLLTAGGVGVITQRETGVRRLIWTAVALAFFVLGAVIVFAPGFIEGMP
jgi:hypothetical protein